MHPAVHWIVFALLVVAVVFIVAGAIVALFGQIGRTFWLSVKASAAAGRDQGKCTDLAAGTGFAVSLVLCGAGVDPRFGRSLTQTWHHSVVLQHLPLPIHSYNVLLPSAAERLLKPLFSGYAPTVDLAIIVFVVTLGLLQLVFATNVWNSDEGTRIFLPAMVAVGLAVAAAIPALLLALWASSHSGGS